MPVSRSVAREDGKEKTVRQLLPLDFYAAVDVVDGGGVKSTRIVFRAKNTKQFFFLFQDEAVESSMHQVSGWLNDLLDKKAPAYPEKQVTSGDAVPSDMGVRIPSNIEGK